MSTDNLLQPKLIEATLSNYPVIQNMARFYVYDMSRYCGFISEEWACPPDGLYESYDFKIYFTDPERKAFLIQIENELAGFALLNKFGTQAVDWNMGEFFILAKFQGKGIGQSVAHQLWRTHPGEWEISVIPENIPALSFWRQAVMTYTLNQYKEQIKTVNYDIRQTQRIILSFNTQQQNKSCHSIPPKPITIDFVDSIPESLEKRMTEDLIAYERTHGIDVNYKRFSIVLSAEGIPCGVINAFTAFAEIYIDDIWVDKTYRGKGYGRKLLQTLEDHFKGQGFNNINLCTSAFQAPEFYKKCGYTAEFTRINQANPKLSKTFFVKFFDEENQTQGIF
ncbi:TPA: GNAT family N-acetyltransferase [Legionella pneumophila]|uniref:N-acetyltransferase GCN5 n=1 Tax=Legionella pneumophila TaxID=446 RepID=A0A378K9Y5_LEGPN|nr:GNAT family N-acetyltransferase [Legionella pneumophila]ADG25502.1 hypothetical protein lpa_03112 [Legionella pneumophila 2300/99 Alcoy]MCO1452921.1 GNAT family N-acetyltransferase [Legionella pneumophila]MCW8403032.1 GNAT family N-acetyltransferase [Legionella pneumophila]MCW8436278.1 GNAT family N-acetyltransferase [Legionella pneumophila]MCW8458142.1 GNAT family N-acetyltransferase [Legionella pneumophila]